MNDTSQFEWEYGRQFPNGEIKWYYDRSENQVRAFINTSNGWKASPYNRKGGQSVLVKRKVSKEIIEVN
jgi:hypothetical protein